MKKWRYHYKNSPKNSLKVFGNQKNFFSKRFFAGFGTASRIKHNHDKTRNKASAAYKSASYSAVGTAPRTRDELKELCRGAGMTESEEGSMFDQWGGGIRELCERGFMNYTVEETKRYAASSEFTPIPEDEAKLLLAERYFTNIAPATIHDAKYFFHTTEKEVKEWLSKLPVISVECEGKTYFYIENGKKYDGAIPKCIFLAGFDQLMLGYEKKESLYLSSENLRRIFNLSGIVMPSILLNGEIVGKWKFDKNRKKSKLTMELFREISKCETSMLEEEAFALFGDSIIIEQK